MRISRPNRFASYKQSPTPADAIFCQLCADITLAKGVEQRIMSGIVDPTHLDDLRELERRAWLHMANYVAAKAFVDDQGDEPV
jgi:hypothetical protein